MLVEFEADPLRQLTMLVNACRCDDKSRFLQGSLCPGWFSGDGNVTTPFGLTQVDTITFHLDRGPDCFFESSIYFDKFVWIVRKPTGITRSGICCFISDLLSEFRFFLATT